MDGLSTLGRNDPSPPVTLKSLFRTLALRDAVSSSRRCRIFASTSSMIPLSIFAG